MNRTSRSLLICSLAAVLPLAAIAPATTVAAGGPEEITYHGEISRIIQQRCQSCHRPGAVAPFPLTSYTEVARRKSMIEWVVSDGIMPPWFATESLHPIANDLRLPAEERRMLLEWIAAGAVEGDPSDAPEPRAWVEGWTLGQPDVVVRTEPVEVPAEGVVDYVHQFVATDFTEDKWVRAVDIRSSAAPVVHHVLVGVAGPERPDGRRRLGLGARTYFAADVPGQAGYSYPVGLGKRIPAGATIAFQLHYTPNGTSATDQTEVGLFLSDGPVETEVRTSSAVNWEFVIPPGAKEHEVEASFAFPRDAEILSLFPHTHLRGTGFHYDLEYPDGRVVTLLSVPRYDFNWQFDYVFAEPVRVPAGTVMRARAWYDNSADNPANPDPTAEVRWGEQTFEEMMIGYVNWIPAREAAER